MQQPPFPPPSGQPPQFAAYPPPGQGLPQPGYPPYFAQPQDGYSFPPSQSKLVGKIALKYGLIFGAIMAVIALIRSYLIFPYLTSLLHLSISISSFLFAVIFTLIYWGIYFCAGIFAARQARQIRAASFACLWASLCYFTIYCVLTAVGLLETLSFLQRNAAFWISYLTSLMTGFAITLFILIGLGIGIGILGGLLGKSLAR